MSSKVYSIEDARQYIESLDLNMSSDGSNVTVWSDHAPYIPMVTTRDYYGYVELPDAATLGKLALKALSEYQELISNNDNLNFRFR